MQIGLHEFTREEYDADPCPVPSLSASIAKILTTRTPRHAWMAHPRLNPRHEAESPTKFDMGNIAHALILGEADRIEVIDAADWRTKAAKEARDAALADNRIPALAHVHETAAAMVRAAHAQLAHHEEGDPFLAGGEAEATLVWQEGDTWCRARPDWLPHDRNVIVDYKTTSNADPEEWGRRAAFDTGAHIQAAFYRRGMKAAMQEDCRFLFVVQEVEPPYPLAVVEMGPAGKALGEAYVHEALTRWRWCVRHDVWPGYDRRTYSLDPPPWWEAKLEEVKLREELSRAEDNRALIEQWMDWQAPVEAAE